MKEKKVTIKRYLTNELKTNNLLAILLNNLFLAEVDIKKFFVVFQNRLQDRSSESVSKFILNPKNAYELGVFGFRACGYDKIETYNGMAYYQGQKSTIATGHH